MHLPNLHPSNVLLLRVAGDEALSWISIFQVLSWLSSKVARLYAGAVSAVVDRVVAAHLWLVRVWERILASRFASASFWPFRWLFGLIYRDRSTYMHLNQPQIRTENVPSETEDSGLRSVILTLVTRISIVLAMLAIFFAFDFKASSATLTYVGRGAILGAGLLLALLPLGQLLEGEISLAGLLFLPILLLFVPVSACFTALGILGFGFGTGLLAFFYEVTVESSPVGTWEVTLFPPSRTGIIYHSQIYENPEALEKMYHWITSNRMVGWTASAN